MAKTRKTNQKPSSRTVREQFDLTGRVAVITGAAGLLGVKHAEAIAELGGITVLIDIDGNRAKAAASRISATYGVESVAVPCDITDQKAVDAAAKNIVERFGHIHILINNAANNPKVEASSDDGHWSRIESFPEETWNADIAVGLSGAFLCSQAFGAVMAEQKNGVILNITSDLGLIGPDQRIYREEGLPDNQQMAKPVTYSVVKAGLIGLTLYLSTYWAEKGVRVNALAPGGVYTGQDDAFVQRLTNLIPMGRMADEDEYKAAVAFLVSDASSYMTGSVVSVDGGRTAW